MIFNVNQIQGLNKTELAELLRLDDFSDIFRLADSVRHENVGDYIHLRALLEFSNHCKRSCIYCGLNCQNHTVHRFRMSSEDIIQTALEASDAGYKTIVLQSGEDSFYTTEMLGHIVKEIKKCGIIITLSCGELSEEDYSYLKECGADRYLLKHETADPEIYKALHPCGTLDRRVGCLKALKRLGYQTGSGFMIGLPNQTAQTIADDLLLLCEIPCDMAGIGPFIPHPETPLSLLPQGSTELTLRAVALARILLPTAHLPATTALGVIDINQKNRIFSCGANVIMKKVTPQKYRKDYEIYPVGDSAYMRNNGIIADRKLAEEEILKLGRVPD